jgi:hypothetical protein
MWKFPLIPTIGRHDIGIQMLARKDSPLWSGTRGPGRGQKWEHEDPVLEFLSSVSCVGPRHPMLDKANDQMYVGRPYITHSVDQSETGHDIRKKDQGTA